MIYHGDCLDVMATFDAESIDAIVTDPPYGLGFMGKHWDTPGAFVERKARRAAEGFDGIGGNYHPTSAADVARTRLSEGRKSQRWHEAWAVEALRVAKPGAYLLAFGGTRTVHRLASAIEDAGWIIRDMLVWAYASGFPKGKANLKPAWEPIVMARKPGPLRPLAIDECRIPFVDDETTDDREGEATAETRYTLDGGTNIAAKPGRRIKSDRAEAEGKNQHTRYANPGSNRDSYSGSMPPRTDYTAPGRWPANVILTDPIFDGGWDGVVGGGTVDGEMHNQRVRDSGTYSRFFLVPKAARSDREPVLGGEEDGSRDVPLVGLGNKYCALCGESWVAADGWPKCGHGREHTKRRAALSPKARANVHPTVKPVVLMRHLVRLVTPSGGVVLDPFLGSGTTALAAEMEGFAWVGIEREEEYVRIAEARLNGTQRGLGLSVCLPTADRATDIPTNGEHKPSAPRAQTGEMDVVATPPQEKGSDPED